MMEGRILIGKNDLTWFNNYYVIVERFYYGKVDYRYYDVGWKQHGNSTNSIVYFKKNMIKRFKCSSPWRELYYNNWVIVISEDNDGYTYRWFVKEYSIHMISTDLKRFFK